MKEKPSVSLKSLIIIEVISPCLASILEVKSFNTMFKVIKRNVSGSLIGFGAELRLWKFFDASTLAKRVKYKGHW